MLVRHLYFLIIVLYPSFLFSQQIIDPPRYMMSSDYMAFREQPEDNLYPHLQFFGPDDFNFSVNLTSIPFEYLLTDSSSLIDTMYSFGFDDRYSGYVRTFSYDMFFRIKSIIGEVLIKDNRIIHQLTNIFYTDSGNVEKINFVKYEDKFDSLIINYLYDEKGLLQQEIALTKKRSDSTFTKEWVKTYFYNNGNMIKYNFESFKKANWFEPYLVNYTYNKNNLPIECTQFIHEIKGIDSLKFIWKFDYNNKLSSYHYFSFENSIINSQNSTYYEYNILGKILKVTKLEKDEPDQYPSQVEYSYHYSHSGILDSICYSFKLFLQNSDSLVSNGCTTIKYDLNGYLTGYETLDKYKENILGTRLMFTRNKYNNVTYAQNETWTQNKWEKGQSIRIVYRQK